MLSSRFPLNLLAIPSLLSSALHRNLQWRLVLTDNNRQRKRIDRRTVGGVTGKQNAMYEHRRASRQNAEKKRLMKRFIAGRMYGCFMQGAMQSDCFRFEKGRGVQ